MSKPTTIDEMAVRALSIHPNDKSGYYFAIMRRQFGWEETRKALTQAANVLIMIDPEHKLANKWLQKEANNRVMEQKFNFKPVTLFPGNHRRKDFLP